jgi:hypothetical protein
VERPAVKSKRWDVSTLVFGDDPQLAFEAAVLLLVLGDDSRSGHAAVVSTAVVSYDPCAIELLPCI